MNIEPGAGAIASNAGDDFHLIWACRKLLKLLKSDTDLSAISVEGPTWKDSIDIIDDKKLYSIDLAEYYGGCNFEQASFVVFSQLKYSSYQMDMPWTISNLCSSSNQAQSNSIIRRLADTYQEYSNTYPSVNSKLKIKLVSNRSLSTDLKAYLSEAKNVLVSKRYSRTADLLKNISAECKVAITNLFDTAKLKSLDFIQFLAILDFEDCGTEIRSIQRAEISKTLGNWALGDIRGTYYGLIMHLREMMLPESKHGYPMDRDYILAALGTTIQQMFPAPAQLQQPSNSYIERKVGGEFAKVLLNNDKATICVHATAGVGKTTLLSNIKSYLPEGSVIVFYDCYGGGSFLLPSERRHLPDVAITQICNDLAVECGTDWIIGNSHKEHELLRLLLERLKAAAAYVKKMNPDAIIVLVTDAADNSKIAAETFKETCFVDSLLKEHWPEGVVYVATARTERYNSLEFPENTVMFPIPTFSLEESSLHIRAKFPSATDAECIEFHNLTDKTPRLQAYALSAGATIEDTLNVLRPNGKTIDSLFSGFISTISAQYSAALNVDVFFSSLINLPRPIPRSIMCQLFPVTPDTLTSISVECQRGFYISDDNIYFNDEDFETYLRSRFKNNPLATEAIAEYMFQNREHNAYSSRYVHLFLNKANRFEDMVKISLEQHPDLTTVGISQSNQIMAHRIHITLARPEMLLPANRLVSCKLTYRLIDLNANDSALYELLRSAPDEVSLYCDELSIYSTFDTKNGDFSELSNAALVFSKSHFDEEKITSYLRSYSAAVSVYYNKQEEERGYHSSPETNDIVNIVESLLVLGEKEQAVHWICSWTPKKYQTILLYKLTKKLMRYGCHEICESILDVKWASPNKLAIVSAYISSGFLPPEAYISWLIRLFSRLKTVPKDRFAFYQVIDFAEYLLSVGGHEDFLSVFISKLSFEYKFAHLPSLHDDNDVNRLSKALRFYVLKQSLTRAPLSSDDFVINQKEKSEEENKPETDHKRTDKLNKEIVEIIEYLLPVYSYRLDCLGNISIEDYEKCGKNLICQLERDSWKYRSYNKRKLLEFALMVLADAILEAKAASDTLIQKLLSKNLLFRTDLKYLC